MSTSGKFHLKWDDFKVNTTSAIGSLREDKDFADVTLACEDGHQVDAHKIILAASSPFFKNLLGRNKHNHPLIYMRGMRSEDLVSIMDFLYYGETNVNEENLNNFLVIAEELKLKGLGESKEMVDLANHPKHDLERRTTKPSESKSTKPYTVNKEGTSDNKPLVSENVKFKGEYPSKNTRDLFELCVQTMSIEGKEEGLSQTIIAGVSGDLKELDIQIKSMMSIGQTMMKGGRQKNYTCSICGKEGAYGLIKGHIEVNHVEGVSIPCNMCEKIFRSRGALKWHNTNHH